MADNHNQQQMKVESNVDKVKAKAKEVAYVHPSFGVWSHEIFWRHLAKNHILMKCSLEDFGKAKAIAFQAASSGSYLYPIKVSSPSMNVRVNLYTNSNDRESTTS